MRVHLAARSPERRLYSRSGDEIGAAFPEVIEAMPAEVTLDGELIVLHGGAAASFNDLQQRLNRKTPNPSCLRDYPAAVRLNDILHEGDKDLRGRSSTERRRRLEILIHPGGAAGSRPVAAGAVHQLAGAARRGARPRHRRADAETGGFSLSRRAAEGAVVQVEARCADTGHCVDIRTARPRQALVILFQIHLRRLARRQAGAGRQGLFRLYRRGITAPRRWVRNNTVQRYGRCARVTPQIVLEIAFDSVRC